MKHNIDPLVLITALLCAPKRKPTPPTPEQLAAAQARQERADWNAKVDAKKRKRK